MLNYAKKQLVIKNNNKATHATALCKVGLEIYIDHATIYKEEETLESISCYYSFLEKLERG